MQAACRHHVRRRVEAEHAAVEIEAAARWSVVRTLSGPLWVAMLAFVVTPGVYEDQEFHVHSDAEIELELDAGGMHPRAWGTLAAEKEKRQQGPESCHRFGGPPRSWAVSIALLPGNVRKASSRLRCNTARS